MLKLLLQIARERKRTAAASCLPRCAQETSPKGALALAYFWRCFLRLLMTVSQASADCCDALGAAAAACWAAAGVAVAACGLRQQLFRSEWKPSSQKPANRSRTQQRLLRGKRAWHETSL